MYEAISATGVKTVVKLRFKKNKNKKTPKKQQLVKVLL